MLNVEFAKMFHPIEVVRGINLGHRRAPKYRPVDILFCEDAQHR